MMALHCLRNNFKSNLKHVNKINWNHCYLNRWKSSQGTASNVLKSAEDGHSNCPKEQLDLSFTNTRNAYKSKTTFELLRAMLVLKLSSYDILVKNHKKVLEKQSPLIRLMINSFLIL